MLVNERNRGVLTFIYYTDMTEISTTFAASGVYLSFRLYNSLNTAIRDQANLHEELFCLLCYLFFFSMSLLLQTGACLFIYLCF